MRRQPRGLPPLADRAADAARRLRARPLDHRARDGDAGAAAAGADRGPDDRPRRGRAGDGAGRGRGRAADDRQHRLALHAGGDRRGQRRGAALVPALLAQRPRAAASSSDAPSGPATARSSSPSTPSSRAGSRATCSRPGCRSSTGSGVANYFQDPVFRAALEKTPEEDLGRRDRPVPRRPGQPGADLGRPRVAARATSLPIVIKGIQHADDAREAGGRGVDGIVVSNHGGRQVDGAIASLDALPAIAEAVGDELTVLFDSGVRGGADVLKALALGADAVCSAAPTSGGSRSAARRASSGAEDGARRARPDDGALRPHPARTSSGRTAWPGDRRFQKPTVIRRTGGTQRSRREKASAARASTPSRYAIAHGISSGPAAGSRRAGRAGRSRR